MRGGAKFGLIYTKGGFGDLYSDSRWRTVLVPFSVINDVIIVSRLSLKIFHVSANSLVLFVTLLFISIFLFMRETWILPKNLKV